ncbi:MAG: cytochrome d ubiquinol oxidase subunit II [Rhodospirillales bacterium]|nr:cytochrome d ubiquinol oxidase subunit II [Rhodospirillales bacterium]
MTEHLPQVWALLIAFAIMLYVMLDGFDLGIGILFGTTREEDFRRSMMDAIAPVWDGNETWLVYVGASLYGGFPLVYAILLPAFYLPITLLLIALILRGVAFEFRYKTERMRWVWDLGFAGGSLIAAFVQGAAVGAIVEGLPIEGGRFVGGPFDWVSPFAVACGIGLVLGYTLIGAGWVVMKTEGPLRDWAYNRIIPLSACLLAFLAIAFGYALTADLRVMGRWFDRPWLLVFPILGLCAMAGLLAGVRRRLDWAPFTAVVVVFLTAFGTMAASFWPYMIPFSVTIDEAAAPVSSLRFLFYGGGTVVLPIILAYTITVYWIFRGKVRDGAGYH